MKDMLIMIALQTAKNVLLPALRDYAAKTPGKLDDLAVNAFAAVIEDPLLLEILQSKTISQ